MGFCYVDLLGYLIREWKREACGQIARKAADVNTGVGEGGVEAVQSGSSASLVLIAIRTSVGRCLCELGGVKGLGFESQKESQTVR
jgi:hypothetical protein